MTTKHTPGPIHREGNKLLASDGLTVQFGLGSRAMEATALANLEHLAACWNACEGINPEAVPMMLAACKSLTDDFSNPFNCSICDSSPKGHTADCPVQLAYAALAKAEEKP